MQHKNKETIGDYIRSFQNGEEKGFNFFFHEYYVALCYFSFQVIKEKSIAEEIAGDALMKLWERRENFDNLPTIKSFLYTATRNASLNVLRIQRRNNQRAKELLYLSNENEANVIHQIVETETYREIHLALKTLPPQCKKIFQMIFLEGKNSKQIADELNLSISTIRNQKARALTLLRHRVFLGIIPLSLINYFL